MFVQTENTPNPNSLKFLPGKTVSNQGSFEITKKDETNNELVRNLLSVNGVEGIFLGKDFISINKHDDIPWDEIKHIVISLINDFYSLIIKAGTYKCPSIKVAEAAKIIENTQRDLNIALINELAIIFNKLGIDTLDVLKAASTKWNFLDFKPGLVGGHCIGVDPYYLTHKAKSIGYNPKIILAGRELNDNMGNFVVSELINKMKFKNIEIEKSKILIMGLTFKENCPDLRNSGIQSIILKLKNLSKSF